MPHTPQFRYFLYHDRHPISEKSNEWETFLPINRHNSQHTPAISITHESYFKAVRAFLEKNESEILTRAISLRMNRTISPEAIQNITVYLAKHGEFYHPAKVRVSVADSVSGDEYLFVLNAAISSAGKNILEKEYHTLEKLNNNFSHTFIPRVYGSDTIMTPEGLEIPMFMGEWFDGYNEFHISHAPDTPEKKQIIVWNAEKDDIFFLSHDQTKSLYQQAAMILTSYYDMETFEQIFPWHHAAGDFVVRLRDNNIRVRLITVRQYTALAENTETPDANDILSAMLLFFLNLSIRMRLDRRDGTGEIVWADETAVEPTLIGFFQGLALQPIINALPAPADICFHHYLSSCAPEVLAELCESVLHSAYSPRQPEFPVIRTYLNAHAMAIYHAIKSWATDSE